MGPMYDLHVMLIMINYIFQLLLLIFDDERWLTGAFYMKYYYSVLVNGLTKTLMGGVVYRSENQ